MYSDTMVKYYISAFEEVLGLSLNFTSNSEIAIANLPNVIAKIDPPSIRDILSPLNLILATKVIGNNKIGKDPFLRKNLVINYIYKIINNEADLEVLDNFTESLQALSNRTYEQEPCQMSFIVFNKNSLNIEDEIKKIGFDYIKFNEKIDIEKVVKDKEPLKLIDSLSLSYVVNEKYEIVGLAKKVQRGPSIYQKMANRHSENEQRILKDSMGSYYHNGKNTMINNSGASFINQNKLEQDILSITNQMNELSKGEAFDDKVQKYIELFFIREKMREELYFLKENLLKENLEIENFQSEKDNNKHIQFIQLKANRVEWFINDSLVCVLSNGKWKVQNYDLVSNIILEYIIRQASNSKNGFQKYDNLINDVTPRFHKFFLQIKHLSFKKIGALLFIMGSSDKRKTTIYKALLERSEIKTDEYRKIIKTNKGHQLNIMSCDTYLFELISSLDGAVLFDRKFDILAFGEFINNSIPTPHVAEAGARTLAAVKSSMYGLSIKVSEDGDLSIFENGSPIIKL
ncbi:MULTISPECIES: hypothetical protein [unclassified Exiguobacterium]|uniref:hypothetical protein n=1 Tax=unclassified Exiguobacterium TaxID=2644629 RepID=UPI001BE76101|nr:MULTISPECIES: hypothetical protein [unclassified Exiguobacterium]